MRILFVAAAGAHVPWIVPLSWACQLAGHEVRVAVRPLGVQALSNAGLAVVPLGDEKAIQEAQNRHAGLAYKGSPRTLKGNWVTQPDLLDPELRVDMASRILAAAEGQAADAVEFARSWKPDLVVHDSAATVGLVAAAAAGVPAIGHTFGFAFGFDYRAPELTAVYERLFTPHGLQPVFDEAYIDPCLPSLRDPHRIPWAPMRLVSYNGPLIEPDWLVRRDDRPRVVVTPGLTTTLLDKLIGRIVDGVGGLGAEVIVAVDRASRAGIAARDNVRIVENFPFSLLLPTADAVVHHSGVGTGMNTASNGVPQVVMPQSAVQDFWAEKIVGTGAGISVPDPDTAPADAIADAVGAVLTKPEYRESAQALRRENEAQPTPGALVGLLEEFARGADACNSPLVVTA
ncbi:nucleotide disphospho-sugar-binding domain-containing protein [Amycolatopsis orientalis]|uniref:nucleotide disphospho-sugar-binding domain-containing protein n=1 Tax=Amycolatopsis orientalis TaxID=31958 RepID=UPI0005CEA252|nr:nucleotide disphospho-sugar-binding domain-containing protein [Amycolatopsis orientalis]